MTVRMSAVATEHIDALVRDGVFDSRAQYLNWLVEREDQRHRALADLDGLRAAGALQDPEVEAIVTATAGRSLTRPG